MNVCRQHMMVETISGYWQRNQFIINGASNKVEFQEQTCPECLEEAKAIFDRQWEQRYTILSTPAALEPALTVPPA